MIYNKCRFLSLFTKFILVSVFSFHGLHAQTKKQKLDIDKNIPAEIYKNPEEVIKKLVKINGQNNIENDYRIKIYLLFSAAYSAKRDYENSLEYVNKANQLTKDSKDELLKISVVSRTGILYHQLKIYDMALQYLDLGEQMMANYPVKDSIHLLLGKSYLVRGFIYKDKLSCNIAIDFFEKGTEELKRSKSKLALGPISISKYNEANCYLIMLKDTLAMQNFKESLHYAKIANAPSLQAFALKGMAKIHTYQQNFNESISTLMKALSLSTNTDDLVLKNEIYSDLSENYLAINNWDKYRFYNSKYEEINSILKSNERKSISQSLTMKEQNLTNNLEKTTQKFYFIYVFIIVLMGVLTFMFLVSLKKSKEKSQKLKRRIKKLQNVKPNLN